MAKLTRKRSEARKAAVLDYFLAHPDATGDEAQAALVSGKLTGEPGPSLSVGMVYELRKRALAMLPVRNGRVASAPAASTKAAPLSPESMKALREAARVLQEQLASLPDVAEVIITRDGARVVRLETREEPL